MTQLPNDDRRTRNRRDRAASPSLEGMEPRCLMDGAAATVAAQAPTAGPVLTPDDVNTLLARAAAVTQNDNAIVAVVDRGGNILGVRVEGGVSPQITQNNEKLVFSIDGAVAEARTGAFFGNDQAPLTSRTIQDISQSTMTQREIQSDPNIPDPNSTDRGPGYVAPVGLKGHFPARIQYQPQVDLFQIEHTNRDSIVSPGPNHIRQVSSTAFVPYVRNADGTLAQPAPPGTQVNGGTIVPTAAGDDQTLPNRFNVPDAYINKNDDGTKRYINAPESYGYVSGLLPSAQSRGIGTLPGGIPLVKDGKVVGGIGVFFPGTTGFATEENSNLNEAPFRDPAKPDLALQAEYIAFVAAGGSNTAEASFNTPQMNAKLGLPALPGGGRRFTGFDLPTGRIDLVGITLDIFGGHGRQGLKNLIDYGSTLKPGNANSGVNMPVRPGESPVPATAMAASQVGKTLDTGTMLPDGYLVNPHDAQDGSGLTASDVDSIIQRGIKEANRVRAAIRLPLDSTARMMLAVTDKSGNVLGLYRMSDATFFSIDVAVAKARNVTYYADPAQLQPQDRISNVPGGSPIVPLGTALTNRTFRYLAEPRYPEGIDGNPPGPFSILNETTVGVNGPRQPASAFQTVQGFDSFNPQTNFHQPFNLNQNGIVFFPGSAPLYKTVNGQKILVGGLGISGDGVDQDDDVTYVASNGFSTGGTGVLRSDQVKVRGARLPYQKFNRQPHEPFNQTKDQAFPEKLPGGVRNILPKRFSKGHKT